MLRVGFSLPVVAKAVLVTLLGHVLFSIVAEYRWYFPADFQESAFLTGRKATFTGLYRLSFYVHIGVGPATLLLAALQMLSGPQHRFQRFHRLIGRFQVFLVLTLSISGLVMAGQAFAGPIAAWGFAAFSLAMACSIVASAVYASGGNIKLHRVWAMRCFLLLCSPLWLRLFSGATIVSGIESLWSYRLNAWLSWLLPLAAFEILRCPRVERWRDRYRLSSSQVLS